MPAGLALAAAVLGARLAPTQLVGAGLVIAAIAILELWFRRRRLAEVSALPVAQSGGEPAEALTA